MRILIIEDEARAANQLQRLLQDSGQDYELLGILDSVEDAVKWFQQEVAPELVFMDIQLADGLSFEIFQKVKVEAPIIFTTAFDQYAIQAFKVNSVDYLLKPVRLQELRAALDKFKRSNNSNGVDQETLKQLLFSMQQPVYRSGLLVKEGQGFIQLPVSSMLYAYSEESVTFGVTAGKRVIIDETMDVLMQSLDPREFFRINRGQIVARSSIEKILPYFNSRLKLQVQHPRDQEFVVSRPKTREFKDWMNR